MYRGKFIILKENIMKTLKFNEDEHLELRELLGKRADALSEATGNKIHSLFD
jgi:hypothetical protein